MIDTAGIVRRVPHRHPVLLVDRVLEVLPGRSLTAVKAITVSEHCYRHATTDPGLTDFRYPATSLLESWAQSAVLLATWDTPNPDVLAGRLELAASVRRVCFLHPVYPGDLVEHRVTLTRNLGDTSIVEGISLVDSRPVMEIGQFVLAMRDITDVAVRAPAWEDA